SRRYREEGIGLLDSSLARRVAPRPARVFPVGIAGLESSSWSPWLRSQQSWRSPWQGKEFFHLRNESTAWPCFHSRTFPTMWGRNILATVSLTPSSQNSGRLMDLA